MKHLKALMFAGACSIGIGGCGGDPEGQVDAAPPAPDASTAARVEATVTYAGTAQGSLVLAAFATVPPMGPPMGFAQDATPTFPQMLAIEDLVGGDAHVLAILDVAPASPTQPGPEDLTVWSAPLVLVEGETEAISLTLVDP